MVSFFFSRSRRRLSRDQVSAFVLLAMILALSAHARFRLPQTPVSDPDTWCYLNPGLSQLLGQGFQHTFGQCFLYPAFVEMTLWWAGDMRWICATQHALGLIGGVFFFLAWVRARALFATPRYLPEIFYLALGLVLVIEEQFSLTIVKFEQSLRPEALFSFVAAFQVWMIVEFIRARWLEDRPRRAVLAGVTSVVLAFILFFLKPAVGLALLPMNLPVILSLRGSVLGRKHKFVLVIAPLLAVLVFLFLPEWHSRQTDPEAPAFLPETLFTVHADLIYRQMVADLTSKAPLPYSKAWLGEVCDDLGKELERARSPASAPYPSLGFNPDYLKSEESIIRHLRQHWPNDTKSLSAFCSFYYWRTVEHQPAAVSRKIFRQLGAFYGQWTCPTYGTRKKYLLKQAYAKSLPFDEERRRKMESYPPTRTYLVRCSLLSQDNDLPLVALGGSYLTLNKLLSRTYLPLLLSCLVSSGIVLIAGPRWSRTWQLSLFFVLLLHSYAFGINLTLAITHSLEVGRYVQNQLVFVTLAQGFSAVLLFEVLSNALCARREDLATPSPHS